MKKILGLIILSLFFYNSAFAKSASVVIPNSSVEDVKSKLIDTHLDQGYDIGQETNNRITFEKNQQLERFSIAHLNKIKKNININEL